MRKSLLILICAFGLSVSPAMQAAGRLDAIRGNSVMEALSGRTGVAVVAMIYAATTGISNVLWAYDWTRIGASAEQNKEIQMWGGLTAAIESFVLGFFCTLLVFMYTQRKAELEAVVAAPANTVLPGTMARSEMDLFEFL